MLQALLEDTEKILDAAFRSNTEYSVYELMRALEEKGHFASLTATTSQLLLYQKNFHCMHALYTLQIRWLEKHWYLAVSALKITLQKSTNKQHSRALSASDTKLAEYYFNWQNYHEADEDSVAELQLNFMKQLQAWLNADEAYLTLGLEMNASWQTINKRYRSLVQNQHPDKGGDTERFLKIQRAYDQLKQKFNR